MYIEHLDTSDLQPLMQNPLQGAKGFFIGDHLGGSGWEVELPMERPRSNYVQLHDHIRVETTLHFADPPNTHQGRALADTSIEALARYYIEYLRGLVDDAKQRFGH